MQNFEQKTEQIPDKVSERVSEILENNTKQNLPKIIKAFEAYIEIRQLHEIPYNDLPQKTRAEMDPSEQVIVFFEKSEEFEPWSDMTNFYGPNSENPWTLADVSSLAQSLKSKTDSPTTLSANDIRNALR
jgi:hypothetical protein